MNPLLSRLFLRLMAPAGDDGSDTSGTGGTDRGDDFEPTEDEGEGDAATTAAASAVVAEGEDDEDDATADPAADKKREQRIPLSRHKDMLEKERTRRADLERWSEARPPISH